MSICLGLGLAAACGFRVFVPLLAISLAAHAGHLELSPAFAWMGTTPALVMFTVAMVLEVAAYYIPWLDHMLDTLTTPAAVVAGTVGAAAVLTDMSPLLRWTLAVIAGGGIAGLIQGSTVVTRVLSTSTTAGLGNPAVATAELGLAGAFSILSIWVPILAAALLLCLIGWLVWKLRRRRLAT